MIQHSLEFTHDCPPIDSLGEGTGCCMSQFQVFMFIDDDPQSGAYIVPNAHCTYTNIPLKLLKIDGIPHTLPNDF